MAPAQRIKSFRYRSKGSDNVRVKHQNEGKCELSDRECGMNVGADGLVGTFQKLLVSWDLRSLAFTQDGGKGRNHTLKKIQKHAPCA